MKMFYILMLTTTFGTCRGQQQDNKKDSTGDGNFTAQRISKTASISINEKIEKVFPLFGAFEERKWSEGWHPRLIYPAIEKIEEGTTFKTPGHLHQEGEYLWIVTKYDVSRFHIQYLVTSPDRFWTITIQCTRNAGNGTKADITYTFTGLNNSGNQINRHMIEAMYKRDLKDWEEAINHYLKTGKSLTHN